MNELACQKLVVDAVKAHGGFAMKMSHKFFAGVVDLLIQIPDFKAGIWEVKYEKTRPRKDVYYPPVTPLQRKMLTNFADAGGVAGLISFYRHEGILHLGVVRSFSMGSGLYPKGFVPLHRGERQDLILRELRKAHATNA